MLQQIVKDIMKDKGITQAKLAELAGYRQQKSVSDILSAKNMQFRTLLTLLTAMGYKIVFRGDEKEYVIGEGWFVRGNRGLNEYDYGRKK